MESNIKLGRISGVKVGLQYTWIIIALLITFSIASRFQEMHPGWGPGIAYQKELKDKGDLIKLLKHEAKAGTITLIYAARYEEHNGALVLKGIL